jgi:hypothetical protein
MPLFEATGMVVGEWICMGMDKFEKSFSVIYLFNRLFIV